VLSPEVGLPDIQTELWFERASRALSRVPQTNCIAISLSLASAVSITRAPVSWARSLSRAELT